VSALPYHAGLPDEVRARNQDAFARDQADVVVATVAFGMGIDKSNVRFVIHRDMPKSVEGWYQEIGRAGRDGLPADCVAFYSWADVIGYDRFLESVEDPEIRAETRTKTVELFRMLERDGCRHQALTGYFDERIEPCASSCDRCLARGIEDLIVHPVRGAIARSAPRSPGRAGAQVGGDASAGGAAAPVDSALFERLRALRSQLADTEGVPAYIVFSDAVLRGMAELRPRTESELLKVSGIGPVKLERYGAAFLELLRVEG